MKCTQYSACACNNMTATIGLNSIVTCKLTIKFTTVEVVVHSSVVATQDILMMVPET